MLKKIKSWFWDFLRKTQKYTNTDMVYLIKGSFWLTFGEVVSTTASFLLSIAFANLLDPVVYGNYRYILSLAGMLGVFSLRGLGAALIQAVSRGMEGSFYQVFKTKLKWSSLGSLTAVFLAIYYYLRSNYILPWPLLVCAVTLPFLSASQIYENFLIGKKYFDISAKYNIFRRFVYVISVITALLLTHNIFWLAAAYFLSTTLANLFLYFLVKVKLKPNRKEDKTTIPYGKHLSLMQLISNVASYLDQFLVFHYLGAVKLAIYNFAINVPLEIQSTLGTLNTLALPKFSVKTKEEIKNTITGKIKKLFLLIVLIIIGYIIISPFIYKIFFPQYLESLLYSQVYIFSFLGFPASILITSLRAQKVKKELYQFKIINPIAKIILLLILIPKFGLWGLIAEEIIIAIFSFFLAWWLFQKI